MQTVFTVATQGPGLYEITGDVIDWTAGKATTGLLTLFIRHTSASLLIQENADPEVQSDLTAYLHRLVPPSDDPSMAYLTHTYEGPDDMPAHIKSALLPVSLQIPSPTVARRWAPGRASMWSSTAARPIGARSWRIWPPSGPDQSSSRKVTIRFT